MNPFDMLKTGELKELILTKEEFLDVRDDLTKREDFKHFIGTALHGGKVCYVWSETQRT